MKESVNELKKGIVKATSKLKGHMDNQARSETRDRAKKQKVGDKAAADQVKALAKDASENAKYATVKDCDLGDATMFPDEN